MRANNNKHHTFRVRAPHLFTKIVSVIIDNTLSAMTAPAKVQLLCGCIPLTLDGHSVHHATHTAHVLIVVYVHHKRVIARSTRAASRNVHHITNETLRVHHTTITFS